MGDMGSGWIPDVYVAGSGNDHNPRTTTANNGDLLLVYEEGGASRDIFFTRSTDGGITWGTAVAVAATATDESQPDIATDPFSGRIFVSYLFGVNGIYVKYSDDGTTWLGGVVNSCSSQCDRLRIASEYWNGATNRQYVVVSTFITATDWNVGVFVSTTQGAIWALGTVLGVANSDVRSQAELAVQHGSDGTDRVFVTYRNGASYPGDAGCIDWSEDHGSTFLGPACNMMDVATPIVIAASHDGTTNVRAYGDVTPPDDIVWVLDDIDPSAFTTWGSLVGAGHYPALTVDGVGQTSTTIGGNYHLIAHDSTDFNLVYGSAPVSMTGSGDWTPIVMISDSQSDVSDSFPISSVTTQLRTGIWYPVAVFTDYRFAQWDIRVTTPGSTWTFDTSPANLDIIFNGSPITASFSRIIVAGMSFNVDVSSPQLGAPGVRYVWTSWSDAGAQAHSITAGTVDTTLTANFDTEYEVTIDSMPTGLDVTLGGTTQATNTSFWMVAGTYSLTAPSPQPGAQGVRYVLSSWSDGGAPTHDITVSGPMFVLANFTMQYEVSITSTPTGRDVTLDGVTLSTPASFWKTPGTYTVSTASPQFQTGSWRYTFASWSDLGARSHDINVIGPTDLAATFTTSVMLTVVSVYGNVVGDGWYDLGDTGSLHVNSTAPGDAVTRYAFTSWSGDATGTAVDVQVLMDAPKTVTANWATEYRLNVTSAHGTATGSGWYRAGTVANVTLAAIEVNEGGKTWQFVAWTGDATGTASSVTVTMNGAKSVTATWREKPGIFGTGSTDLIVFSLLIVVIVVVVLLLLLMMRRKKRKQQQPASPMPPPPPPPPPTQQGAPPQQWPQQQAPQQWPPQQPPQRGAP